MSNKWSLDELNELKGNDQTDGDDSVDQDEILAIGKDCSSCWVIVSIVSIVGISWEQILSLPRLSSVDQVRVIVREKEGPHSHDQTEQTLESDKENADLVNNAFYLGLLVPPLSASLIKHDLSFLSCVNYYAYDPSCICQIGASK